MLRKSFLWSLAISGIFSIFLSIVFVIFVWLIFKKNLFEFELYIEHLIILFIINTALVFVFLYLIILRKTQKMIVLLEKNSFYQSKFSYNNSFNPMKIIIKNLNLYNTKIEEEMFKLNKLEKYRREYIGNVSHELKTPVFNIQGYISSLLEGGIEDDKIAINFLQKADKNVDRMINIIEDLQTISMLETGELKLEIEPFEINNLIEEVIENETDNAAKSNIFIDFKKTDNITVKADRNRIKQVLSNLIINSIKYGNPDGGKTVIRIYELFEIIKIEVSDNGIGIDQKHLTRIFERFYRVDNSRSREKGGSGLGLAIVKHIIEAHRQKIEVMSTPGAGTVFSFSLQKEVGEG